MKKNLFFVAVVAAALAGCSSDESLSNVNESTSANGDLVPVELGLSRGIVDVYQTRGTGTVGDTVKAVNDYYGEDLYVLMTNKPKVDPETGEQLEPWCFTMVDNLGKQFDGSFKSRAVWDGTSMTTDVENDEVKVWAIEYKAFTNQQVKYYPVNGQKSDFFAFYVDDAALDENGGTTNIPTILPEEPDDPADADMDVVEKYVEFQINGSQDILAGKAFYPDGVVGGFSAKTARAGYKPRIPMQHMLTRLTFTVQPNASAKGVKIDSILVTSQYKGQLIVAYNEDETRDPEDLIVWDEDEEVVDFSLACPAAEKDPNFNYVTGTKPSLSFPTPATYDAETGEVVTPGTPLYVIKEADVEADGEGKIAPVPVGEAMFVKPNETSYAVKIYYQYPVIGVGGEETTMEGFLESTIKLPNDAVLEDGYSYNVNIKIYGIEEIMLETTLENWKDGGQAIEIDPDAE